MKKTLLSGMLLATFLVILFSTNVLAQNTEPRYKDVVIENPDAEADMKVVIDYVNALIAGDLEKAKSLLADNYMGYGPASTDSSNAEQTIKGWKEVPNFRSNQKANFVTQSFRVLLGEFKGNWVSMWGTFSFTQNGKNISFPFQYTVKVTNGKIERGTIYYDNLFIYQALGYKIVAPEKAN